MEDLNLYNNLYNENYTDTRKDEIIQKKSSELEEIIQKHKITRNIFPPEWVNVSSFDTFDHKKPGFVLIDLDTSSFEYTRIFNIMNANPYKNSFYKHITINEFNQNIVKILLNDLVTEISNVIDISNYFRKLGDRFVLFNEKANDEIANVKYSLKSHNSNYVPEQLVVI